VDLGHELKKGGRSDDGGFGGMESIAPELKDRGRGRVDERKHASLGFTGTRIRNTGRESGGGGR